jgi:two-component system sensor histidine kinase YesM
MSEEQLRELTDKIHNEDTTSFGLVAAYKRLKLLYGDEFRFDIVSKADSGTSIKISIPRKADIDNETIL